MSDYEVKKIDDMEAVFRGAFKRARAELGVEAFGIQVIDMPPNYDNYPEHDHTHDNQEEVFLVMRGGGEIEIDGERFPLDDNHIARVGGGVETEDLAGFGGNPPRRPRRRARRGLHRPGHHQARRARPDGGGLVLRARRVPLLRDRLRLEPGAAQHRRRRVAPVARVGPRALAEREDRATGVGDQSLVDAAVAEPVSVAPGHVSLARPAS
jgi:hypothetical protein